MTNFDDMKLAIEALSGGKNTVILDDLGMPSVMVKIPKMLNSELFTGGSENVHPGFIVNGVVKDCMYVSKYQNIVVNGRGYSLPGKDPAVSMDFDTALSYCRAKGNGWSLMPHSLWAAIALWSRKNGTMPHGNNNYGRDHIYTHEKGIAIGTLDSGKTAHTQTGSGPDTWNHDHSPFGVSDMNGNIWEWNAGLRLNESEVNIIENANVFDHDVSLAADSQDWKAFNSSGSLIAPGASGAMKQTYNGEFKNATFVSKDTPELGKALILIPADVGGDYGGDYKWIAATGERLPIVGAGWGSAATAGVFAVYLNDPRSIVGWNLGFRSAYCEL